MRGKARGSLSVKNLRRDDFGGYDKGDAFTLNSKSEVQVV